MNPHKSPTGNQQLCARTRIMMVFLKDSWWLLNIAPQSRMVECAMASKENEIWIKSVPILMKNSYIYKINEMS